MLTTSLDLRKWDGIVQLTPQASGRHTGVLSMCAKDDAQVTAHRLNSENFLRSTAC